MKQVFKPYKLQKLVPQQNCLQLYDCCYFWSENARTGSRLLEANSCSKLNATKKLKHRSLYIVFLYPHPKNGPPTHSANFDKC